MMAEASTEPNTDEAPPQPGGPYTERRKPLDDAVSWIEYAVQQAQLYQRSIEEAAENTLAVTKARLDRIRTTSSAHLSQTLDSLQDVKSEYNHYEEAIFGKIKEGIFVAASHPLITTGAAFSLGLLGLKRPRRFLYYNTMRLFASEEALLSKADARVQELRKSIDLLKAEREKVEESALRAEEELTRGRTKLKHAGKQIQGVIRSAYKIENKARGLKDILGELPRREASRFRSQVSNLASEAKRERSALTKEVTKISNYGISV